MPFVAGQQPIQNPQPQSQPQQPGRGGNPSHMVGPVQQPYGPRGSSRQPSMPMPGAPPQQMGPPTPSGYGNGFAPNRGYQTPMPRTAPMGGDPFGGARMPPNPRGYTPPTGPMGPQQQMDEVPSQNRMMMQPGPMDLAPPTNYGRFTNPGGMRGRYNQSPYQARQGSTDRAMRQSGPYGDLFSTAR